MSTCIEEDIQPGMFVGLREEGVDEEATERLQGWIRFNGIGPFKVSGMIDPFHVSLEDSEGNPIHFGGSDTSLHIGYVRRWVA